MDKSAGDGEVGNDVTGNGVDDTATAATAAKTDGHGGASTPDAAADAAGAEDEADTTAAAAAPAAAVAASDCLLMVYPCTSARSPDEATAATATDWLVAAELASDVQ